MWFVYILECKDKTLYTGITKDVERRFSEHKNKKGAKYTASHQVDKVVYVQRHSTMSSALKRELQIKRLSTEEKKNLLKK